MSARLRIRNQSVTPATLTSNPSTCTIQYEEIRMRATDYDFLADEDRQWIARCTILAVVLFLGLFAGVALYDDANGVTVAAAPAATPAAMVTTAADMSTPRPAATTAP
jgi:hypothetical protein